MMKNTDTNSHCDLTSWLQWQYGASFPQRRSPLSDQPSRRSHQSRWDCRLQDRRQRDPNRPQSTKDPWKVRMHIFKNLIFVYEYLCHCAPCTCIKWEFQLKFCEKRIPVIFCIRPLNLDSFRDYCFKRENLMCNVDQDHPSLLSTGKMGTLNSWPKETTMQWTTEDYTSRANTGWRKKTWWDEQEGEQRKLQYYWRTEKRDHQLWWKLLTECNNVEDHKMTLYFCLFYSFCLLHHDMFHIKDTHVMCQCPHC